MCVRSCKYGAAAAFGAERRLRQFSELPQPFRSFGAVYVVSPLTIFNRLPAKVSLRVMRGRVALPRFFCEISRGGPHGRCGFCGDAMKKELSRILIAGTNSGCGKTTFVSGLLTALKRREKDLRAFKCGPDYIDPMFHASALGVPCRNLDLQFFDENTLRFSLAKNGGSLSVIEGVMGYYDGVGLTTRASSYAVAMASDTPAVLVVDARGAAHSVLAVIGGFLNLHPKSHIRGVILNRCSAMLYPRMKQAIADQFGGAVLPLGYLPVMKDCTLESRHLGLITAQEMTDLQEKLEALADQIEKSVDIPALCALAASAPALSWEPVALPEEGPALRIAVARDNAFCFYYEDNLDLLRSLGAELVPFSPIADAALPENIRGLYLGGGYPELYAESLSENQSMKDSIRQALEAGLPCIAECGGFLYLQKELEGRPMVGFLPGTGHNTGKLSRFGYVTLTAQKDNLLCAAGEQLPAHEFHYYDTTCNGEDFLAQKADGRAWRCGIATENLYAGFPHFHFYAHPQMAARFLEMCRKGSPERGAVSAAD